jgi:hypothetical protein
VPQVDARLKVGEKMTEGHGKRREMRGKQTLRSPKEPPCITGPGTMVNVMGYGEKRHAY